MGATLKQVQSVHARSEKPLLEARAITKKFGSFVANDQVDLLLDSGQVHAILGENGAGKSTLMKTLYGVHAHDGGELFMNGEPVVLHPPTKARENGISMVFQDFRIIPSLTVLENISLAHSKQRFFLNKKALKRKIKETSDRYHLAVDPDAYVRDLDLGQRQRVEILKVLVEDSTKVVIFDEPTSVLTPHEVDAFINMIKMLREDGYGILLITHKIAEVLACADRVSVLRAGKLVFTSSKMNKLDEPTLIAEMMGDKEIPKPAERTQLDKSKQEKMLEAKHITVTDDRHYEIISDLSLTIHSGQILGIAGISGSGQRELTEALFGIRKLKSGELYVKGKRMDGKTPADFIDANVTYISEDPLTEQIVPGLSILEHMVLSGLPMHKRGLGVDWTKVYSEYSELKVIKRLGVASSERIASTLSGGNVQRLILARALVSEPDVLIVSYPSRGLDIATVKTIHQLLLHIRDQGAAILLISEDLNEIFELADDIVVLGQGKLAGPFNPEETNAYEIGEIMLEGERS